MDPTKGKKKYLIYHLEERGKARTYSRLPRMTWAMWLSAPYYHFQKQKEVTEKATLHKEKNQREASPVDNSDIQKQETQKRFCIAETQKQLSNFCKKEIMNYYKELKQRYTNWTYQPMKHVVCQEHGSAI
ncbi:hypothetical protein E2320_018628 [Naja naja]|nr:hypothetical protein E2320_018628 [Naja naja]